jgi:hypothetical protein
MRYDHPEIPAAMRAMKPATASKMKFRDFVVAEGCFGASIGECVGEVVPWQVA